MTGFNERKSCWFGLPRVPFVNCCQFMYSVVSLLVLRAGCGIWCISSWSLLTFLLRLSWYYDDVTSGFRWINVFGWTESYPNIYTFPNLKWNVWQFHAKNVSLPVLGPLLFSLYINDISSDIESEIRLFADDCVCYREIKDQEDTIKLQRDIDRLGSLARKWGMRFQPAKCNVMQLTRKRIKKIHASYTSNRGNCPWKRWKH